VYRTPAGATKGEPRDAAHGAIAAAARMLTVAVRLHGMRLPPAPRQLRAIGFDDGPFARKRGAAVPLVGVVTSGTRLEGMLFDRTHKDGWRAGEVVARMLTDSKFATQVHVVLLDGIAFGGLNVVDLPQLHAAVGRPCICVMRKMPDLDAMARAIRRLPGAARRLDRIARAGPIHRRPPFYFQACGIDPDPAADALRRLTDRGNVPEPLRLAHHIAAAFVDGQSRGRA
jgi:hypothetical protein